MGLFSYDTALMRGLSASVVQSTVTVMEYSPPIPVKQMHIEMKGSQKLFSNLPIASKFA